MTDRRQRRVLQLLAEDGEIQSLLGRSPADVGHLVMVGDILLQAGVHSRRDHRKTSTVIGIDANGVPTYGSISIRLNPKSLLMPMLSPSIWSSRDDYLCDCLCVVVEQYPYLSDSDAARRHSEVHPGQAVSRKPRRSPPAPVASSRAAASTAPLAAPVPSVATVAPVAPAVPAATVASQRPPSGLDGFVSEVDSAALKRNEMDPAGPENINWATSNNSICDTLDERDAVAPADSSVAHDNPKGVPKELVGLIGFFDKRGRLNDG